jgi:hypothetical protein
MRIFMRGKTAAKQGQARRRRRRIEAFPIREWVFTSGH